MASILHKMASIFTKDNNSAKQATQIDRLKMRSIAVSVTIIASVAIIIFILYGDTLKKIEETQEINIQNHTNMEFEQLWTILTEHLIDEAKDNISPISDNIEREIHALDLDKLEMELDKDIYPTELMNIFRSNLQGVSLNGIRNGRNNTLAISNDRILVSYSYYLYPTSAENSGALSGILDAGWNPGLAKSALSKLYKHNDAIICTETLEPANENHIRIISATKENLKTVYMQEGLDGFKNYQFYAPVYITDTGDVFGQDDIIFGQRDNTNHKFIIIQEFNLYDQIQENYIEYFDTTHMGGLIERHQIVLRNMYIVGTVFAIFIIVVILELVNLHDVILLSEDTEDEDNE